MLLLQPWCCRGAHARKLHTLGEVASCMHHKCFKTRQYRQQHKAAVQGSSSQWCDAVCAEPCLIMQNNHPSAHLWPRD